ncbi:MAG: putative phage abortive infection protein [Nitrospirota bacterium]
MIKKIVIGMLIGTLISIPAVIIPYCLNFNCFEFAKEQNTWGVFGDYVGGLLNPIFAFFSFLLLLGTFLYQKQETEDSKKDAEDSKATNEQQRFENIFFNMVNLHHEIVKALSVGEEKGKNCFKIYRQKLEKELRLFLNKEDLIKTFRISYNLFFDEEGNKADLGHYFRNLFQILRIIDEKEIKDKKTYIRIIRAQLSDPELAMLYYNSLSCYGYKYIKYINDYDFLDNLDVNSIEEECKSFLTKDKKINEKLIPDPKTDEFCKRIGESE